MTSLNTTLQKKVENPTIPYIGTIFGGLQPGKLVVIHGFVPEHADRFQVDFQCGSSIKPRADVAFHFNPRFKRSGCIVCNTLREEKWGLEEITYEMPFKKGQSFEIVFMILHDKFQVSVNGKHFLLYKHRIDCEKIDTLGISGKVQVKTIGFVSNNQEEVPDDSQLVVPYVARLTSSLEPGRTIVIKGEVNETPECFAVNLKANDSNDIALHLNPRMKDKAFVRNSYLNYSWGEEERHVTHFPFSPGMYFELIIFCETHHYSVAINGVHTLEYKHRYKQLNKINTLEIIGDIQLLDVRSW
ncbi:hypothetical protein lerEdw1_006228 [Lerista edwardsae]|nr:hypothetical protein lerEdw1_006228 [Lerista edwardsae]